MTIRLDGSNLYYSNGVKLGEVVMDVDGFYYFWPELRGGHWDQSVLRQISDLLEEKNKPWQDKIDKDFGGDQNSK